METAAVRYYPSHKDIEIWLFDQNMLFLSQM